MRWLAAESPTNVLDFDIRQLIWDSAAWRTRSRQNRGRTEISCEFGEYGFGESVPCPLVNAEAEKCRQIGTLPRGADGLHWKS